MTTLSEAAQEEVLKQVLQEVFLTVLDLLGPFFEDFMRVPRLLP